MLIVRVLVIAESSERAAVVRAGLSLAGHELTGVMTPQDALSTALAHTPADMVVLETRSPHPDLLDSVLDAMGNALVPLVIFSDDGSEEATSRAVRAGAASYIVDGLNAARIPAILNVACARFEWLSDLRAELEVAQQKLAERKIVERAKGLLMKARNLSEDEAYHTLRRMAMERNRRMGEMARSVIEMAELLN